MWSAAVDAPRHHGKESMPPVKSTAASLRVLGDDLDPDTVSSLLGCAPTYAWRKGEVIRKHGVERIARSGLWLLEIGERTPGDEEGQVRELLGMVTAEPGVWKKLREICTIKIFFGLFTSDDGEEFYLSAATMCLLAERQINLGLDIYGPNNDDMERLPEGTD